MHLLSGVIWSFVLCRSRFNHSLECQDVILIFFSALKTPGANTGMNYFEAYTALKM